MHIDLGIAYLFKLLTVECIGIGLIVLLALFYELLEAKALRIVVSLVCWAFLAGATGLSMAFRRLPGLVHISCVLVRSLSVLARAGRLAQANASMSANKDALHALSMASRKPSGSGFRWFSMVFMLFLLADSSGPRLQEGLGVEQPAPSSDYRSRHALWRLLVAST